MNSIARRAFLQGAIASAACACATSPALSFEENPEAWICPPCGCAMDGVDFAAPGVCPACGMALVPKPNWPFEPSEIAAGAGAFLTAGGASRPNKLIRVHYYRPAALAPRSRILIVIPGAGRNGGEYRDAWNAVAEEANILVAALEYREADYDFAAYHMGGLVRDLSFPSGATETNVTRLRDEEIAFTPNPRREEWLFSDFDRIFDLLVAATGSAQTGYDIFGHSAGGQILHRLALARPHARARRIIAANAGFYTLPDLTTPLLFGLDGSGVDEDMLASAFGCRLTLLLGENDNSDAAGGIHLHTPLADRQGLGRLSRGQYFFGFGKRRAAAMGVPFRWEIQVVPNVGHDFRAMSAAAARLLFA